MKNKTNKKTKSPKKEVKRPAFKKPRPRKYVEAKVPPLPPVPTETIPVTKDTPPDVVKLEFPKKILGPQTPEERFVELLHKAADELRSVADNLSVEQPRHPMPDTVYYKPGGIGAILRLEVGEDMLKHFEKAMSELRETHGWTQTYQVMEEELAATNGDIVEAVEDPAKTTDVDEDWANPENHPHISTIAKPAEEPATEGSVDLHMWESPGWDRIRESAAKDDNKKAPKEGWLSRFFHAIIKK